VPGPLLGIAIPIMAAVLVYFISPQAQRAVAGVNVPYLVGLQATRVAGWGDRLAAGLAIPAAIVAYRQVEGWEKWVLAWNVIGLLDFVSAVTFGLTSQPGSPLQIFMEAPGTAILADLPWRTIPGFYVPLFIIAHIALFIRLWPALSRESQHRPGKSAAALR
jgi:hypothetical protein